MCIRNFRRLVATARQTNRLVKGIVRAGLALSIVAALTPSAMAQGGAAGKGQPRKGGTIIVAIGTDPAGLNPNVTVGVPDVFTGCMLYDGLVRHAAGFKVVPGLAKSWDISADGKKYTFNLNKAVWNDGKPVTSEDVKFTLLEVSSKFGPFFSAPGKMIETIDTPDPQTVIVKLTQPFGPFLYSLSCDQNAAILPAHVFRNTDVLKNPATLSAPLGNGPFKLAEWVRGDHLTFIRNESYWRAGEPYLDRIIVKIMPDASARLLALRAGEIDYIDGYYVPLSGIASLKGDKQFQMQEHLWPSDDLIILNTKRPPLDNPKVRQALMIGLDREYLKKNVFFGIGDAAQSAINTKLVWANNPAVQYGKLYPLDPKRAAAMLDKEGLKPNADGVRFTINLAFDMARPEYTQLAQAVQRFWRAIGVNVVFQGAERPVVLRKVYSEYEFDATFQVYTTSGDPALGIARLYVTDSIKKGQTFNNSSQYSNPEVDALFAKGRDAVTEAERAKHYYKVQEILARDLPVLPIHQQAQISVAKSSIRGLWQASEYQWWGSAWLEK